MPRPRKPVAVMEAEGNPGKLSRAQLEARRASELHVEPGPMEPPDFLTTKRQRERFATVAGQLADLGIGSDVDSDAVGRYVLAREQWVDATRMLRRAMRSGDGADASRAARIQGEAFKQARQSAADLGLTIESRCRIVAPARAEEVSENPFARFVDGGPPRG